ncbi:MAG TPA: DUF3368 domain-containing protein [Anaerolineales bacterium]|nr:DUF3368 domain-containing protein [Anaerolineales bacterium]
MPVVSDTSPVLNLAVIGHLGLLRRQFGDIVLPPAVLEELRVDTDDPGTLEIKQALGDGWLRKVDLKDNRIARALRRELDDGEAEAIALALELGVETILMDERDGRLIAKTMGLAPIGVLGVLVRAKQEADVSTLKEVLNLLQNNAGFYIGEKLAKAILSEAGE